MLSLVQVQEAVAHLQQAQQAKDLAVKDFLGKVGGEGGGAARGAGQGRAGQGRAGRRAGQGRAGQGRAGQDGAGQGEEEGAAAALLGAGMGRPDVRAGRLLQYAGVGRRAPLLRPGLQSVSMIRAGAQLP